MVEDDHFLGDYSDRARGGTILDLAGKKSVSIFSGKALVSRLLETPPPGLSGTGSGSCSSVGLHALNAAARTSTAHRRVDCPLIFIGRRSPNEN